MALKEKNLKELVFRGAQIDTGAVVTVNDDLLDPARSLKLRNHSPDGFEWGYGGSGPAQLALAMLLAVTNDEEKSVSLYQDFKRDFISILPSEWEITKTAIEAWMTVKLGANS